VPADGRGDTIEIVIEAGSVAAVMRTLREDQDLRYEILADICGVDTGGTMQVVYHLWSPLASDWLRVIADGLSREDPRVPSDMFGIVFEGNRDLRRIYMPPDYLAFPLRKDFSLADDASRAPGGGIRHMEQTEHPAETRATPVLRSSPGTGAVLAADGQRLRVTADRATTASLASGPAEAHRGDSPAGSTS